VIVKKLKEFDTLSMYDDAPSQAQPTLLQCFVNPNFKTNEDEFWSDSIIIKQDE
jgi:hypothetical protein